MSSLRPPNKHGSHYDFLSPSRTLIVTLILLITDTFTVNSTPHFVYTRCNDTAGNYNQNSLFQSNLNSLISNFLNLNSSLSSYSNSYDIGESPYDIVHALYYCRGNVQPDNCRSCLQAAASRVIQDCPTKKEAIIWYEECTLRYAARVLPSPEDEDVWVSEQARTTITSLSIRADPNYAPLFDRLIMKAAYNYNNNDNNNGSSAFRFFMTGKAMVTSSLSLQGLVQCAPQMSESECETCLRMTIAVIPSCCGWKKEWVMVLRPCCLVEYGYTSYTVQATTTKRGSVSVFPHENTVWGYARDFLVLVAGTICFTVAYYLLLRPIRHKLRELTVSRKHTSRSDSSHMRKGEESKEQAAHNKEPSQAKEGGSSKITNEDPRAHPQGPCALYKGLTECPTHNKVSCIMCKITDEIQSQKQVPAAILCPPMPPQHVMWVCTMPNVNQSCYWRTNHC